LENGIHGDSILFLGRSKIDLTFFSAELIVTRTRRIRGRITASRPRIEGLQMKFSTSVVNKLKYYVYLYSGPVSKKIFYVGKGKVNRVFSPLEDTKDSAKVEYINKLRAQGLEPDIEILIHGRMSLSPLVSAYEKQKININVPAILIRIRQAKHSVYVMMKTLKDGMNL